MKIRKIESALLIVGFGALLLGLVMFFVAPLLVGGGFDYQGLDVFGAGAKAMFSFDFENTTYILLALLFLLTILCTIWWAVIICVKKHKKHLIPMAFVLVSLILVDFTLMGYFVADVRFNGETTKLFDAIMLIEGNLLGKILSMLVIALFHIALMFLTLYAFIDVVTMMLGDKIQQGFVKTIKEQIVEALPVNPLEGLDDRKAREEAFFKSCIDTGEFTQYDEVEFDRPLEGFTEEPVVEQVDVEEKTSFVTRKTYIRVSSEKKQTISVK